MTSAVRLYCSTSKGLEEWRCVRSAYTAPNRDARHHWNVTAVLIVANNRQLPINTALINGIWNKLIPADDIAFHCILQLCITVHLDL